MIKKSAMIVLNFVIIRRKKNRLVIFFKKKFLEQTKGNKVVEGEINLAKKKS
jgi:hypothetical protein